MSCYSYSGRRERDHNPAPDLTEEFTRLYGYSDKTVSSLNRPAVDLQYIPDNVRIAKPDHPDSWYQASNSTSNPYSHSQIAGSGYSHEQDLTYGQGQYADQSYSSMRGSSFGEYQHPTHHRHLDGHAIQSPYQSHEKYELSRSHYDHHASRVSPYPSSSGRFPPLTSKPLDGVRDALVSSDFARMRDARTSASKLTISREKPHPQAVRPVKPKKLRLTGDIEYYDRVRAELNEAKEKLDPDARYIKKLEKEVAKYRAYVEQGLEKEARLGFKRKEDVSDILMSSY